MGRVVNGWICRNKKSYGRFWNLPTMTFTISQKPLICMYTGMLHIYLYILCIFMCVFFWRKWKDSRKICLVYCLYLYKELKPLRKLILKFHAWHLTCPCKCVYVHLFLPFFLVPYPPPENWLRHCFNFELTHLKNMESTCKNLDFWLYLKYRKI